jgi:hypothetical protein
MYSVERLNSVGNWVWEGAFTTAEEAASYERRLYSVTRIINTTTGREVIAY